MPIYMLQYPRALLSRLIKFSHYELLMIFLVSYCLLCRVVKAAGTKGHILNLGHGVLQKTPEEAVAHFFDVTRSLRYDTHFQGSVAEGLQPVA
jgi:hypothetical protein